MKQWRSLRVFTKRAISLHDQLIHWLSSADVWSSSVLLIRQWDCSVHTYANGHGWSTQVSNKLVLLPVGFHCRGTVDVCCCCVVSRWNDWLAPPCSPKGQCQSCCSTPSLTWTTPSDGWREVCCTSLPSKMLFLSKSELKNLSRVSTYSRTTKLLCVFSAQLWLSRVSGSAAEERSQPKLPGHLGLHPSAPRREEWVRASRAAF